MLAAVLAGAPLLSEAHAQESEIPGFVSQVFEWYADGLISDTEVLNAIEYLVGEGIIELPSDGEAPAGGYGSLADSGVLESLSDDNRFVLSYEPTLEYDSIREWMQSRELLESEVRYYNRSHA